MAGLRTWRDRLRRRGSSVRAAVVRGRYARTGEHVSSVHESVDEERLHDLMRADPNNEARFKELAAVVRQRAADGHAAGSAGAGEDDAVWALAEELAHNQRAWYPLIELARLSLGEDREAAMRRLGIAAERDPSGTALTRGLSLLRDVGDHDGALALGMGHWRPASHPIEAGRHMVSAAVDAGRLAEARRHLDALGNHPDATEVAATRQDLERAITRAEKTRRSERRG